MHLAKSDIVAIAELARITINDDEHADFLEDLLRIIEFVDIIHDVDTMSLSPLFHSTEVATRMREDEITESNQRDDFQQQAPAVHDGYYLVPKVIE